MPRKRAEPLLPGPDDMPALALQQRFGTNFKTVRVAAGLTQTEISKISGIQQTTISEVESGQVNLTLRQMQRLASAVDHDVSLLLVARIHDTKKT